MKCEMWALNGRCLRMCTSSAASRRRRKPVCPIARTLVSLPLSALALPQLSCCCTALFF